MIKKEAKILKLIENENEIEMDTAAIDDYDPECLSVIYRPANKRVLIRQPFQNNSEIELSGYELIRNHPETAIFFNRISKEEIMISRNYTNSKIIDIDDTWTGWTIGRTITNEELFDFSNAVIDPNNLEHVYVKHIPTGFVVKIIKTFQNAPTINQRTNLQTQNTVSHYEPSNLRINKSDIHFATLPLNGQTVKVKRDFTDASILDVFDEKEISKLYPNTDSLFAKLIDPISSITESEIPSPRFSSQNSTPFTIDMSFKGDVSKSDVSFSRSSVDFDYTESNISTPRAFTPSEGRSFSGIQAKEEVKINEKPQFFKKLPMLSKNVNNQLLIAENFDEIGNEVDSIIPVVPVKVKRKKKKDSIDTKELEDIKNKRMQNKRNIENTQKLPKLKTSSKFSGSGLNQINDEDATFGNIYVDSYGAEKEFDILRKSPN